MVGEEGSGRLDHLAKVLPAGPAQERRPCEGGWTYCRPLPPPGPGVKTEPQSASATWLT